MTPIGCEPLRDDPPGETVDRHRRFPFDDRGAGQNTVQTWFSTVRALAAHRFGSRPGDPGSVCLHEINAFSPHPCRAQGPADDTGPSCGAARPCGMPVSAPRSWWPGLPPAGPDACRACPGCWNRCDRSTVTGRGDHTILSVPALPGVRVCEVAFPTLDDIDRCSAGIPVVGRGGRRDVLPREAGEALAAHLQAGWPVRPAACLWIAAAPVHGFRSSAAVRRIGPRDQGSAEGLSVFQDRGLRTGVLPPKLPPDHGGARIHPTDRHRPAAKGRRLRQPGHRRTVRNTRWAGAGKGQVNRGNPVDFPWRPCPASMRSSRS